MTIASVMSVRCVVDDMTWYEILIEPCCSYTGNVNIVQVDYLFEFVFFLGTLWAFANKKLGIRWGASWLLIATASRLVRSQYWCIYYYCRLGPWWMACRWCQLPTTAQNVVDRPPESRWVRLWVVLDLPILSMLVFNQPMQCSLRLFPTSSSIIRVPSLIVTLKRPSLALVSTAFCAGLLSFCVGIISLEA